MTGPRSTIVPDNLIVSRRLPKARTILFNCPGVPALPISDKSFRISAAGIGEIVTESVNS